MKKITKFLRRWNELLTIPVAFVLWFYSPQLLRLLDPTAAAFDAGIFQIFLFAIIGLLIFHGIVWLILKLSWPTVYKHLDNLSEPFQDLNSWQQIKFSLAVFSVLLLSLVLLANTIA